MRRQIEKYKNCRYDILNDFKLNGKKWEDGEIMDTGNGKVYSASILMLNNDELKVVDFLARSTERKLGSESNQLQAISKVVDELVAE